MADSLRDQLLKTGLVDEKKLRQARQGKKPAGKKPKAERHQAGGQNPVAEAARRAQAERSRELNRKQQEAAARKALEAQLRQIVDTHKESRDKADVAYHFQQAGKVRRIHVTRDQQERLSRGQLGIVVLAGNYELLPRAALDKIRERDPGCEVICNEPDAQATKAREDDPYAGYEVPDDLMW